MSDEKLSYKIWEDTPVCPHCGSDLTQESFGRNDEGVEGDWFECLDCDRSSAMEIVTPAEQKLRDIADEEYYNYMMREENGS